MRLQDWSAAGENLARNFGPSPGVRPSRWGTHGVVLVLGRGGCGEEIALQVMVIGGHAHVSPYVVGEVGPGFDLVFLVFALLALRAARALAIAARPAALRASQTGHGAPGERNACSPSLCVLATVLVAIISVVSPRVKSVGSRAGVLTFLACCTLTFGVGLDSSSTNASLSSITSGLRGGNARTTRVIASTSLNDAISANPRFNRKPAGALFESASYPHEGQTIAHQ